MTDHIQIMVIALLVTVAFMPFAAEPLADFVDADLIAVMPALGLPLKLTDGKMMESAA